MLLFVIVISCVVNLSRGLNNYNNIYILYLNINSFFFVVLVTTTDLSKKYLDVFNSFQSSRKHVTLYNCCHSITYH